MKSIKESRKGDFIKEKGDFVLTDGHDEVCQQIRSILKSNISEWKLGDDDYGIHYSNIITKRINEDLIKDEIRLGISQCTEEITIESLELGYKKELRLLYVELKAFGPDGERYDTSVELLT